MATYIDVAALVGIKIHSSGVLDNNETVTVPASCYAQFSIQDASNTAFKDQSIMIAGGGTTFGFNGSNEFLLNGVTTDLANNGSTNHCHYVIFSNNQ